MNEIDLYQWVHERFQASAILKNYPLVTRNLGDVNASYIFINITDHGRGCFVVKFDIVSCYQGEKEIVLLASELKSILTNDTSVVWRDQRHAVAGSLVFKVKYL